MKKVDLWVASMLFAFIATPAHAYFDPGTGVVVLQVLIAAGIGIVYRLRRFFTNYLRALVKLLRR